jgi:2,3-bisphosphoglycerate-independent phosphoglycerate mutase
MVVINHNVLPVALRRLLVERSIFRRLTEGRRWVAFASAFGVRYWEVLAARRLRHSAGVIAAAGASVRFRNDTGPRAGSALTGMGYYWRNDPRQQ